MSEKVEMINAFAKLAFERFDGTMKNLSEKELDWRPTEETNSIRWILTHLSQQWNVGIYRILRGDPEYKPKDWPEDYVGNKSFSFKRIMDDVEKGKSNVMNALEKLDQAELEVDIPLWGGTRKRQFGLLIYLSEIFHHVGQITYIRGAIGRRRQTDKHFLT
ncbi:MAG: DinB family protein [Candidatus Bathyarchaeota archaeon]|nr:DinB family protein [Candidatus Bathyarchaeota archaeon]MDH5732361.1 DinB family protein [Candidatus Bathyarchaeota archaeon]